MEIYQKFKQNDNLRRMFVLLTICGVLFLTRKMINLILLTFILTYLITRLINLLHQRLKVPNRLGLVIIYGTIVVLFFIGITVYLPQLVNQTVAMIRSLITFYQKPAGDNPFLEWIRTNISFKEIEAQLSSSVRVIFRYLSDIGTMGVTFVMSLILSLFFSIEKEWVKRFSQLFYTSKLDWFSRDVAFLGKKFSTTFGVVLEAQLLIALVNTSLTTIGLLIMGFPQVLILVLVIFVLSLIPVAGVIISFIPLALIGYTVGGLQTIIYVLLMIGGIHLFESYFLNPKLMSSKTNLPIFYTFIILVFSENFFGLWGLIIGIPTVVFLLDLLGVRAKKNKG